MKTARDIMHAPAPTVDPSLTIKELSDWLLEHNLDGACVVDEAGALKGVVTSMDLIFKEKKVHIPSFFLFLDAILPTSDPRKTYAEVRKIAGSRVDDILTPDPITVSTDAHIDELATLMVDKHLTILPVVDGERLVGMVTKPDVLRARLARS